jgi:hypothetical protein
MAFDVITPANLGRGAITTEVTTFYTVDTLERVIVKTIDIANTGASSLTITLYLVPNGGAPNNSNALIPTVRIKGNTIFQWCGSQILEVGDTIQAVASANGLSIHISGGRCS